MRKKNLLLIYFKDCDPPVPIQQSGGQDHFLRLSSLRVGVQVAWIPIRVSVGHNSICVNLIKVSERLLADWNDTPNMWPDLLVTVNFTVLGINSSSLVYMRGRTVSIVVGLHQNVQDVLDNTLPLPLVPDVHLLASITPTVRQQFSNLASGAWGFKTVSPGRQRFHLLT